MKQKALTTPDDGSITGLSGSFNGASASCEIEVKFIVPGNADQTVNHDIFTKIRDTFSDMGWIKIRRENNRLMSRQLDTPDRALLQAGRTLRIRGGCDGDDLRNVRAADICLKQGKTIDVSGAMRRGEFQTRVKNFQQIDLDALLTAYPKDQYPEVHEALNGLKPSDLREFFRIDCIRHRYVMDVPATAIGLDGGKIFAAELLLDDNAYVLDVPKLKHPLVFHHDLEVECEALFKPCEFDPSPDAAKYVSSPLTREEGDRAMAAIRDKIQDAAGGVLMINGASKAERGFLHLDTALAHLQNYVMASKTLSKSDKVKSAFRISAAPANDNEKLHYFLERDFGPVLRDRGIAKYNPK